MSEIETPALQRRELGVRRRAAYDQASALGLGDLKRGDSHARRYPLHQHRFTSCESSVGHDGIVHGHEGDWRSRGLFP